MQLECSLGSFLTPALIPVLSAVDQQEERTWYWDCPAKWHLRFLCNLSLGIESVFSVSSQPRAGQVHFDVKEVHPGYLSGGG